MDVVPRSRVTRADPRDDLCISAGSSRHAAMVHLYLSYQIEAARLPRGYSRFDCARVGLSIGCISLYTRIPRLRETPGEIGSFKAANSRKRKALRADSVQIACYSYPSLIIIRIQPLILLLSRFEGRSTPKRRSPGQAASLQPMHFVYAHSSRRYSSIS